MLNWYVLSVISFLSFGLEYFLFKVAAEKKYNSAYIIMSLMITSILIALASFLFQKQEMLNFELLIVLSLLGAIAFVITTISRIEMLKHVETNVAFPIVRLSTIIVIIFSIIYFQDKLSVFQIMGITLAFFVVLLLARQNNKNEKIDKNFKLGIIFAIIALISGAMATILNKFVTMFINKLSFIILSSFFSIILAFIFRNNLQTNSNSNKKYSILIGAIIGVFSFIGFYAFLLAIGNGPLSVVYPITNLSFLVVIVLSSIYYKEKLTIVKIVGILLTIFAILLVRM